MKRTKSLLAVQFTMPGAYPPLEHLSLLLARRGWRVELRGYAIRGAYGFGFVEHPLIRVEELAGAQPGWRLAARYARYVAWAAREARRLRPDWVWASEILGALPGLAASVAAECPLVFQEHDTPAPRPSGAMGALSLAFRREAAARARFCVVPGVERGNALREAVPGASDVRVAWNCPLREEVAPARRPREAGEPLRVYYHGTLSPDRLPAALIHAVAAQRGRVHLLVRGYDTSGTGSDVRRLDRLVEETGAGGWVSLHPPVPTRGELWPLLDTCHVGLALVPTAPHDFNLKTMAGPSNKAFDYLARGVSLIVTNRPEWTDLYAAPGYARPCTPEDAGSLGDALDWFVRNPAETWEMAEAGRERIRSEWNYETVFASVLRSLLRE